MMLTMLHVMIILAGLTSYSVYYLLYNLQERSVHYLKRSTDLPVGMKTFISVWILMCHESSENAKISVYFYRMIEQIRLFSRLIMFSFVLSLW